MKSIHVVGAALLRAGRCLVAQRGAAMSLPFKWEFPGGKVEPAEVAEEALRREIHEELGIEIDVAALIGRSEWCADGVQILLDVYRASWLKGEIVPVEHAQVKWVEAKELLALDWAPADVPVVSRVVAEMKEASRSRTGP